MSVKSTNRRLLSVSVASICKESGFEVVTKASLETLTEMLQAYLVELTNSCRKYCEHSHRTTPDLTDCVMALAEVGSSAHAVNIYYKSNQCGSHNLQLNHMKPPTDHKYLKTGLPKVNPPSYIPGHFVEYPEIHSFVRTPSLREPANQYELIRGRVAKQNIMTEESLIRFLSHTKPSDSLLFDEIDLELYPQVSITHERFPFLKALLPSQKEAQTPDSNSGDDKADSSSEDLLSSQGSNSNDNAYVKEPKRLRTKT